VSNGYLFGLIDIWIQQQKPCQHNDEERSFTGTWVTDELKKALEKGYVVQRIYEVWHFDETEQYDPKTKNFPQKLFSISLANALNP
jgi:hypothetical protein